MSRSDWVFGGLAIIGMLTLVAFGWLVGLVLFIIGGIGLCAKGEPA